MKTQTISLVTLALGLTLALPAIAQDTMKYDPIMEKRADLRMKWIRAQREAADSYRLRMHRTGDSTEAPVIDRPDLVDFMARSNKRADLHLRVSKIGLEAAYDEWKAQQHGK